jgi:hypothetical protein
MMRDCQMYSRKATLYKTIINCSNHGFMLKTYRTDTFSSWKYTITDYYIIVNSDVVFVPN